MYICAAGGTGTAEDIPDAPADYSAYRRPGPRHTMAITEFQLQNVTAVHPS